MVEILKAFKNFFSLIFKELNGGDEKFQFQRSLPVNTQVTPFSRLKDVPADLGHDKDYLIHKAELLFSEDTLRLKWLMAVYKMRKNNIERIMEPLTKTQLLAKEHYSKWRFAYAGMGLGS